MVRSTRGAVLAASCWLALAALPADSATLSGYVTDAGDGAPLHFATVVLQGLDLGTLTNESGYFAVRQVPTGTCTLVVSHIGYAPWRRAVEVPPGVDLRQNVGLVVQPELVPETVVVGRPRAALQTTQTSVVQIPVLQIQQMPAVGERDLLRSLQLLPGVQSVSDISSGLYVRGGGPDQNLTFLDHVPVYNPSHAFGFFSAFNSDAIKEASLFKGAYAAPYQGNLGAILDVTQREGNHEQVTGRGGIGLVASRLLIEGPLGSGAWMAAARRTYLDPVLAAVRAAGVDVPSYHFDDVNLKLSQRHGENDRFFATYFRSQDALRWDPDRETFVDLDWGNQVLSTRWDRVYTPTLFGRLQAGYSRYRSRTSLNAFGTPVLYANRIRDLTARADLDYYGGAHHAVSAGAQFTRYWFEVGQSFNRAQLLDLSASPVLVSGHLQDEWRPDPLTTLRAGVRISHFSQGARTDVMPRLGISRALRHDLRLRLGAGSYRQYMQLVTTEGFTGTDFWVPLDGSVDPGRALQGVVGLEWEPSATYRLGLETYYSRLDDLVELDDRVSVDNGSTRSQDVFRANGRGYAAGAELFIERRTGRTRGWLGYTLGYTRRRFEALNQGRWFAPKYDRRHDLSLVVSHPRGPYTLGASFSYGTGQAFTPAAARYTLRSPATGLLEDFVYPAPRNSARLLPYHRLDVSCRRQLALLGLRAEAYVQVFNLYSRRNEWFVQYDTEDPETRPQVTKMLPILPTLGIDFAF